MKRPNLILIVLTIILIVPIQSRWALYSATEKESFPPFYIKKVSPSEKFVAFKLTDTEGKTWENNIYNPIPYIFITGKWGIRHDLKKWAIFLNSEFGTRANVLWVFNPSGTEFSNQYKKNLDLITEYQPPIPVIIDSHSYVGRSLKIDYDIPTIVGITRNNLLSFIYRSPLNEKSKSEIKNLIYSKILTF